MNDLVELCSDEDEQHRRSQDIDMKERPILFSAPMVRSILDGTKTQTRRVVKLTESAKHVQYWAPPGGKSKAGWADPGVNYWTPDPGGETDSNHLDRCPYGQPGDRLWVREAWRAHELSTGEDGILYAADSAFVPIENTKEAADRWVAARREFQMWRPSIHMPRWASRITLEIVGVRVERLNDISERDAWAEGCEGFDDDVTGGKSGCTEFAELWQSINGPGSWEANPWVWVIEFRQVDAAR